ncbi:uncharacterized protein LOC101847273 isoform X1 [Aplysia californica]|uniref:Uncharacterized protein LOC101847273 isoform X1 n=1 Tax=Aplysia californica TaxID=6500 RepID=A0ABM0JWC0_APLCA|nr:uncharacterized protein LOC101847273 isoform X1 [Aplysia californica]
MNGLTSFLYVRSCHGDFSGDPRVRELCTGQSDDVKDSEVPGLTGTGVGIRVTDVDTNVTYYNEYCALCNRVERAVEWRVQVQCNNYLQVYQAQNELEFLKLAVRDSTSCFIWQYRPTDVDIISCDSPWWINGGDDIVNKCNVSGQWTERDTDVEEACANLEALPMYRVIDYRKGLKTERAGLYKNVFCALCNRPSYPMTEGCRPSPGLPVVPPFDLPFTMLLGLRPQMTSNQNKNTVVRLCSEEEWLSPDGLCMPVECSAGKTLTENGTCVTAVSQVRGLAYSVRLWLLPAGEIDVKMNQALLNPSSSDTSSPGLTLIQNVETILKAMPMVHGYEITSGVALCEGNRTLFSGNTSSPLATISKCSSSATTPTSLSDDGHVSPAPSEEHLISHSISSELPVALWLDINFMANRDRRRDEFEIDAVSTIFGEEFKKEVSDNFNHTPLIVHGEISPWSHCFNKVPYMCETGWFISLNAFLSLKLYPEKESYVKLSPLLTCPFVRLNQTQFSVKSYVVPGNIQPSVAVEVTFGTFSETFTKPSDLYKITVTDNKELRICQDLLSSRFPRDQLQGDGIMLWSQYFLTLLCFTVSVGCLVLTLMTYALFPVLRGKAGKNNMALCVSLMAAQVSLLTSSHVKAPSAVCTGLGICTHFLWLVTFCCTLVCCHHMYKVFTDKTRNSLDSSKTERLRFMKRLLFVLLLPLAVVLTVVVTTMITTEGSRTGYGETSCYMDSTFLVGTTVVGPLVLITTCNVAFFTLTVIRIQKVRLLQMSVQREDRLNVYVYMKLSTITGAFWLLSVTAEALDMDALRLVAIVFNGSQGLFIFLSYVCNKRVLAMYKSLLLSETVIDSSASRERGQKTPTCSVETKSTAQVTRQEMTSQANHEMETLEI